MIVAQIIMLGGALLILVAGIGVVRFRDVLARMHSLSKASTLGLVLVVVGGAGGLDTANDITFVVLVGVIQVLTSPVAAILIARATYRAAGITHHLDDTDELAANSPPS